MAGETRVFLKETLAAIPGQARAMWRTMLRQGPSQVQFWFIALIIGFAAGFAALGFRLGIAELQTLIYGTSDVMLASHARTLPWYIVLFVPVVGGLVVGLILHWMTPDGRVRAVADVINGAALQNGRVEMKAGLGSAAASLITLSTGGSTGREGPVVHIGAMISTWVSRLIRADGITGRDLLGCAVAAAVSASFNTPIAGALFALEVVLRHFAVHAFAPIVIASVAGTIVSRANFGNVTEFFLPTDNVLEFYVELPAFLLLGLVAGLVAVMLMRTIFWADDMADHLQHSHGVPRWLRPAAAGLMLGMLALAFPHIIGVGYETTTAALTGQLAFWTAVTYAVVKAVAVVITMAGRMGGGVFSPSLMMGALTGLAFGQAATGLLPEVSGSETLYALAGMGAVAAAVLGAPISTTLIVFELTGDWQTGLAVMTAVSLSTALASRLVDRSFFLTQLERRNIHLAAGPQAYLPATFGVGGVMRIAGTRQCADAEACKALIAQGFFIESGANLEQALPVFTRSGSDFLPVITPSSDGGDPVIHGALYEIDALKALNAAMAETAREEHS